VKGLLLIAALALAPVVAGCGGGGGTSLHTLAKTRSCLVKNRDVKIDNNLDFVASTATGGALHLKLPHNAATVVFGESVDDADNINDAYHRFKAKNVGLEDIIRQDANVVILFRNHPGDEDLATVQKCLK
jgi:hypothetical protein